MNSSNPFSFLEQSLPYQDGSLRFYSLPALQEHMGTDFSRLPVSIRIVLESLIRHCDGMKVTEGDVRNLARWNAVSPGDYEVPFTVGRIVLQDFTGVPLLVDLAAMRDAARIQGKDPGLIEPLVPVDLVVDHSVQVDFSGSQSALDRNLSIEFIRNQERYEFLKWGQQAFETFSVVPPGIGIVHQVNLEYLARGVLVRDGVCYPDTLVGTDSHTTMINGIGVVGWGVGGIEAEAGMLGQPVTFLVPEVVGVHLKGRLNEGVTATDLTLRLTQLLRKHGVVGKFVEFFGEGARALSLPDRATIANMAPEYGATMGFFPVDEEAVRYYRGTGRSENQCSLIESYFKKQNLFGIPSLGQIDYSSTLELDLASVVPCVSGPKRPQDRIDVPALRETFDQLLAAPVAEGGYGIEPSRRSVRVPVHMPTPAGVSASAAELDASLTLETHQALDTELTHGSVLIAAITSCTNTSNPSVMLAAGLVAKKANAFGLTIAPYVKTSLAPGSRVVTDYLEATGLQKELDHLGFQTVGYGCTTCIGNSGPLSPAIEEPLLKENLICASVLSGNRNFEARVHGSIKANFLMSPPLVVAYALAGRVDLDLTLEPLGTDSSGNPVFLKDIWPSQEEITQVMASALKPEVFNRLYQNFDTQNPKWTAIKSPEGATYSWNASSTYIQDPPFFQGFSTRPTGFKAIENARPLGIFGDSVTTDHISPAGAIKAASPAGRYLLENGVAKEAFNSFGSRRGNDRVMTRGTFGNVRIKNLMIPATEGGYTLYFGSRDVPLLDLPKTSPEGTPTWIFDAAEAYAQDGTPLIIIGGDDYGMGSSRDWAAKGTLLLGVRAVITKSFERIHRSNLIGMGVLPLNFKTKADYDLVKDLHDATFSLPDLTADLKPAQETTLLCKRPGAPDLSVPVLVRLDTPAEVEYYLHGGILPFVLRQLLKA
ncbi:MAG: aconitate hydratase AcnA [Candidatus Methylacidiphilales bacterium]